MPCVGMRLEANEIASQHTIKNCFSSYQKSINRIATLISLAAQR